MNKKEFQIILGSMFGDGCILHKSGHKHCCFIEGHSFKQKDYLLWKYNNLKSLNPIYYVYKNRNVCNIDTRMSEDLDIFREKFYPKGLRHKIISYEMLKKLTPLGLAIWYMDDGYYCYRDKIAFLYSRTDKLKYQKIIKKYFEKELKLFPSIFPLKNGFCVGFVGNERIKFLKLVEKFVHSTLIYKLGELNDLNLKKVKEAKINKYKYQKKYRNINRDVLSIKKREYHYKNREKLNKKSKEYYHKNKHKK